MNKHGAILKEKEKPVMEKMLREIFMEGKSPKEVLGYTPKRMENMYAFAYNLFTHGKFKEARGMMNYLLSLDPQPRYALGCATALHQMKEYILAAGYYFHAIRLGGQEKDPVPYYYLFDCFKNLNEPLSALLMLRYTIDAAGDKPEHAVLKERAILTKESYTRDVNAARQKEKVA